MKTWKGEPMDKKPTPLLDLCEAGKKKAAEPEKLIFGKFTYLVFTGLESTLESMRKDEK